MLIFSISEKIAIFGPSRPEACLAKPTGWLEERKTAGSVATGTKK